MYHGLPLVNAPKALSGRYLTVLVPFSLKDLATSS
jgi:hypothetical protein